MLTLAEFTQWTGISTLETFLRSIAILVSSILLVLKVENYLPLRFLHVFLPLFMADALTLYFHFIVFIRTVVDGRQIKSAISGNTFHFVRTGLIALFELMLYLRLERDLGVGMDSSFSVVFMPVWFLLALLGVRACRSF